MTFAQYDTADYRKVVKDQIAINANDNKNFVLAAA